MSQADDGPGYDDAGWQRLDKWLWCARVMKHRAECARLVEGGLVRINRQATDKPHARVRVGDILTLALGRDVRVVVVGALAERRGPAREARALYVEVPDGPPAATGHGGCEGAESAAYPAFAEPDDRPDPRSA